MKRWCPWGNGKVSATRHSSLSPSLGLDGSQCSYGPFGRPWGSLTVRGDTAMGWGGCISPSSQNPQYFTVNILYKDVY